MNVSSGEKFWATLSFVSALIVLLILLFEFGGYGLILGLIIFMNCFVSGFSAGRYFEQS